MYVQAKQTVDMQVRLPLPRLECISSIRLQHTDETPCDVIVCLASTVPMGFTVACAGCTNFGVLLMFVCTVDWCSGVCFTRCSAQHAVVRRYVIKKTETTTTAEAATTTSTTTTAYIDLLRLCNNIKFIDPFCKIKDSLCGWWCCPSHTHTSHTQHIADASRTERVFRQCLHHVRCRSCALCGQPFPLYVCVSRRIICAKRMAIDCEWEKLFLSFYPSLSFQFTKNPVAVAIFPAQKCRPCCKPFAPFNLYSHHFHFVAAGRANTFSCLRMAAGATHTHTNTQPDTFSICTYGDERICSATI